MIRRTARAATAATLLMAALAPLPATPQDWVLSAGGFETAVDVTAHNMLAQDRADMLAALAGDAPDYATAMAIYASGRNFPWKGTTHSLGRFADNYNGDVPPAVPRSVAYWGDSRFQTTPVFSALAGTDGLRDAPAAQRRALADGATLATILNWTRFELVMSERKALAAAPNWSRKNGSPKNWNEVFAFHHGPDGRHSVREALAATPEGEAITATLYAALADGQVQLLQESWPARAAARAARALDHASLTLRDAALADAAGAEAAARAVALARAQGLWRAGAEAVLAHAPDGAPVIAAALAQGEAATIDAARSVVADAMAAVSG